jgi:hypothetical protein
MLYDSTKTLLRDIVQSLETADKTGWDDQIESGKECLYEMHQMSGPAYKGYKSDGPKSPTHNPISEKVNRAMPHVKSMVSAIRRKDQTKALQSGKAACAEL